MFREIRDLVPTNPVRPVSRERPDPGRPREEDKPKKPHEDPAKKDPDNGTDPANHIDEYA